LNNNGYYYITSRKEGNNNKLIHRLIYEEYVEEIPENHVIHHIDGDKTNNNIKNLQCMSKEFHSWYHTHGENNPNYGKIPWNKGYGDYIKGDKNGRFGRPVSLETRLKISKANKGKLLGRKFSEEHKQKISKAVSGEKNHNYGKKISKISRLKQSNSKIGRGLFGFTSNSLKKRENPERRCWSSSISYNNKITYLGYYEDPLSCQIVYKLVKKEIYVTY